MFGGSGLEPQFGISETFAARVYKTYGSESVNKIKENPYILARDISGIGFKKADDIARQLGIAEDSLPRARGGINYALQEARGQGHVGVPEEKLLEVAARLLSTNGFEMPFPTLREGLHWELLEGHILSDTIGGEKFVFDSRLHRMEKQIARRLRELSQGALPWTIDVDKAIEWVQKRINIPLGEDQVNAIRLALTSKVVVITGGPGTGKTTIVNAIMEILTAKRMVALLAAPTGKAAKRMAEATGRDAATIHRTLGTKKGGGFQYNRDNRLPCHVLDLDETSMLDVPLTCSTVNALPDEATLILVGDIDQLPSVGPGRVLGDIIDSGMIPVARLTEVHRQAAGSNIIVNVHRINRGEMPEFDASNPANDFYWDYLDDPGQMLARVRELVVDHLPQKYGYDPIRDIFVLTPSRRSNTGVQALNIMLQEALNPLPQGASFIERFGFRYAAGDKVMQRANNYDWDVYNGETGIILNLDDDEREVTIDFDSRQIVYDYNEMDEVTLAYAGTVHKTQGSQYPAVVLLLSQQHHMMLKRNLVYTGASRAERLFWGVGQKAALQKAVRDADAGKRWTKLREWLIEGV